MKIVEDFTKTELFKRLGEDTSCCNKCKTKGEDLWWMSEFDEYWCLDCRDEYIGDVEDICPKCGNLGYYVQEYWIAGDQTKHYDHVPCGCKNTYNYIKEKELSKCKCHDENNIMVPYELVVKADQILFLVGQHGNAVLDSELREQMIKVGSELRKIYMNMKGE